MDKLIGDEWQPKHEWPNFGMDIVRSTLRDNHVYLQGKNGDVWRVWLEFDGMKEELSNLEAFTITEIFERFGDPTER
jgi:hypothetical protein